MKQPKREDENQFTIEIPTLVSLQPNSQISNIETDLLNKCDQFGSPTKIKVSVRDKPQKKERQHPLKTILSILH